MVRVAGGKLHDSCLVDKSEEISLAVCATGGEIQPSSAGDLRSDKMEEGVDNRKSQQHEQGGTWFELMEQEYDEEYREMTEKPEPRSPLRLVDMALEFELVELGGRDFFVADAMENEDVLSRAISDGDSEEGLNELAAKCFESDPDMHVPLKKLKGVRKEKSIVVLERRTRSKKFI